MNGNQLMKKATSFRIGVALTMMVALMAPATAATAQATDAYSNAVLADNPVHYYRLGEAAGPGAADLGTGGTAGTYGATATLGQPGLLANSTDTATGFDGATATDFVDTNVTSLSASAFTVEAWINANSIGTTGHRIVVKDEIGSTGAWLLWFNQGNLRFQVRNSTNTAWVIAETTVGTGTDHHIAATFDGGTMVLYVDGAAADTASLGTATAKVDPLPIVIGADSDPTNARGHIFDGTIDEVAIYETALTQPQIQAHIDATTVVANVDLGVTKTVDILTPGNGDTITYTITATNNGPDAASGVTVTDLLPAGITYTGDDGGGSYVGDTWTIGSLANSASATLNITATVNATGGTIVDNTATIAGAEGDPNATNNSATASFGVPVTDLYAADTGSLTLPDATTIPVWSYNTGPADVATRPGGPTITVTAGQTVTINLFNQLSEQTAIMFQGQPMVPDRTGASPGGSTSYTFTPTTPGTYLYEAGLVPGALHQVPLGLYGALVVLPTTPGQAYNNPGTTYDDEAVLVLSEIDPNLNADPTSFDLREYSPEYFLINGRAYPDTDPISTSAGSDVLLRYVNAGNQYHSMALLGAHQTVIALDGSLMAYSRRYVSEAFGPGETADAIVSVPANAADGSMLPVYDSSLLLHNGTAAGFGGMLTFIEVSGAGAGPDIAGPTTSNVAYAAGTLTATVDETNTGNANIAGAEYFLDSVGANGTGTAVAATDGAFDSPIEGVTASLAIPAGPHTLYVHGQDANGNWGAFGSVLVNGGDVEAPITSGLALTPNPSNGSVDVALHATGDDSGTGGSAIVAAEYTVDAGPPVPMTVNLPAVIASLDANIPAGLTEGIHSIAVRSEDASGNWSLPVTIDLVVDATGPVTSGVVADPNPNNGALGVNPLTAAVRVTADVADTTSNIDRMEGFIDTLGADGAGFPFLASDGAFDSLTETGFADIPLTTVTQLADGSHTIYVHGKDAVGNWGPTATTILVIERDAPVVSAVAVNPATTDGTAPVALSATATDASSDIVLAEWFANADPGIGDGTPMSISGVGPWALDAMIDATGWAPGSYTISVRARDAAGNWSATDTALLTVTAPPAGPPTLVYFSTVGGGNGNSVPGVAGPYDDSDVYLWDTDLSLFSRILDGSGLGLPGNADVDGLALIGDPLLGEYYISFKRNGGTNVPSPGGGNFVAQDEDVVLYDAENGEWQLFFAGAECSLNASNGRDIDALDVVGGNLYFSTIGNASVGGVPGPYDDADIYMWDGAVCSRVFDASASGLPGGADIDGLTVIDADTFYVSFAGGVNPPGPANTVQDEDVAYSDAGTWSVFFDATAEGMGASNGRDLDAIDVQ